jgi:tRNA-dihydrouridine synthase B
MNQPSLTKPFSIGDVEIANRILLAPLAGIGNWFVRLQARRHGAGLAVSEMVSSFALHHGNRRTLDELLVVDPREHPVSVQLFGHNPEVMRSAARIAAAAGADLIDINMGCPVRKVLKTGAGAALLTDHELAVRLATAAIEGSGRPVTVKLRSGLGPDDRSGVDLAQRLAAAGVAAIAFHPRPASARHAGSPDHRLVRELVARIDVPVILSGGLSSAARARRAYEDSGAAAVMIARGALGNPWIFEQLAGRRADAPHPDEVVFELRWVIDSAAQHFGARRAAPYLRKFYPWYLERLGLPRSANEPFQRAATLDDARRLVEALARARPGGDVVRKPDASGRRWTLAPATA